MPRLLAALLAASLLPLLAACPIAAPSDDDSAGTGDDDSAGTGDDDDLPLFRLWSDDLVSDDGIEHDHDCHMALPPEYSCFNDNPEIRWEDPPAGTATFALIFDDPTADDFEHWAVYNIPGTLLLLDRGISGASGTGLPAGAVELQNGFTTDGYVGSCPPAGQVNLYRWRLWALGEALTDMPSTFGQLTADAEAASLGMAEMCHVFDGDDSDL